MSRIHRAAGCAVFAAITLISAALGQQGQSGGTGDDSRYHYNPLEQSLQWLRSEQIKKEVELTADQETQLDQIRQDYYAKTQQIYKDLRGVSGGNRYDKLYEMRQELSKDVEGRVRKVLLKPQANRLREIMIQMALLRQGTSRTLVLDEVAQTLGITKEQQARLKAAENQARQEMQEKVQKFQEQLRADILKKVLGELNDKQRTKLSAMQGDVFKLEPPPRRPGGQTAAPAGK
jgi:Spy/CpxP family protein refolding chaperone